MKLICPRQARKSEAKEKKEAKPKPAQKKKKTKKDKEKKVKEEDPEKDNEKKLMKDGKKVGIAAFYLLHLSETNVRLRAPLKGNHVLIYSIVTSYMIHFLEAITDASNKIKAALELLPNAENLPRTQLIPWNVSGK